MPLSTRSVCFISAILALSSSACSEAVPVASEGAYSVSFLQAASSTAKCIVGSHNAQVGSVTPVDLDALVKDSVNGARLQCTVKREGNGFSAAGIIEDASGNHIDFLIPSIDAGANEANPASGTVGFRSATTQNIYRSPTDAPCKFWIAGTSGQIDDGRIWASFRCEQVRYPANDSSCQIAPGSAIAMQNCDQ
ncbi:MAG: hypothetical protein FJ096_05900 [Deltaproteobacteria bacterium]|nr:hypothetical protein [Deltaproteobacteria bacterium]